MKRYPISCAACGERHVFRSLARLAAWVKSHCCWSER